MIIRIIGEPRYQSLSDWMWRRLNFLKRANHWLIAFWKVFWISRFASVMTLVGVLALIVPSQSNDIIMLLAERSVEATERTSWQFLFFLLGVFAWSFNAWYWARAELDWAARHGFLADTSNLDSLAQDPTDEELHLRGAVTWWRSVWPRLLGVSGWFAASWSFASAANSTRDFVRLSVAKVYDHVQADSIDWLSDWSANFLVLGLVFLALQVLRRRLLLEVPEIQERYKQSLSRVGRGMLIATAVASLVLLFIFTFYSTDLAAEVGAAAILIFWAAIWIPLGTRLSHYATAARFPVVAFLVLLAVLWSFCPWLDNHHIKTLASANVGPDTGDTAEKQEGQGRQSVAVHFERWWAAQLASYHADGRPPPDPYPVFVVATEGGASRGAYMTAILLATIQDAVPKFRRHLFAISGVSGGSLGAAVFASLLAAYPDAEKFIGSVEGCPSDLYATSGTKIQHGRAASSAFLRCQSHAILAHDFLSPTLATWLYPTIVDSVIPIIPSESADRARSLERAWEQAWDQTFAEGVPHEPEIRLSDAFSQLDAPVYEGKLPSLFLNGTLVDNGQRIIVSNNRIDPSEFVDVIDAREVMGEAFAISTAVTFSARFPYVSPAGLIRNQEYDPVRNNVRQEKWLRVVDGGYFENSGAATGAEILRIVVSEARSIMSANGPRILPVAVQITNDPWPPKHSGELHALNEAVSPVLGLLHTRTARGVFSRSVFRTEAKLGHETLEVPKYLALRSHYWFRICDPAVPISLGWAMSDQTQKEIRRQLGFSRTPYRLKRRGSTKDSEKCSADDGGVGYEIRNSRDLNEIIDTLRTLTGE